MSFICCTRFPWPTSTSTILNVACFFLLLQKSLTGASWKPYFKKHSLFMAFFQTCLKLYSTVHMTLIKLFGYPSHNRVVEFWLITPVRTIYRPPSLDKAFLFPQIFYGNRSGLSNGHAKTLTLLSLSYCVSVFLYTYGHCSFKRPIYNQALTSWSSWQQILALKCFCSCDASYPVMRAW